MGRAAPLSAVVTPETSQSSKMILAIVESHFSLRFGTWYE